MRRPAAFLRSPDGLRLTRFRRRSGGAELRLGTTALLLMAAASALISHRAMGTVVTRDVVPLSAATGMIARPMEAGPVWVAQAAWGPGEQQVVVADPGSGAIYLYDLEGRIARKIVRPGQGRLEFRKPAYPFLVNGKLLVGSHFFHWIWLDAALEPVDSFHLEWPAGDGSPYRQLWLYSFDAGRSSFVGVGEAQDHDGVWSETAVFEAPFATSEGVVTNLGTLAVDSEESSALHDKPGKIAACGDEVYVLRYGVSLSIEAFGKSRRTLTSFPAEYRQRPALPPMERREDVEARAAAVRTSKMADGLFCLDERWLLLLAHEPIGDGSIRWRVFPIDPAADVLGDPIELPTRATSIVFVPGSRRWAVLEKGPMKQVGLQPLVRMVVFPTPRFDGDSRRP
ncbi:MAG: hypothetical protein F9K16_02040 [Thermoanaerobaculia bacterium]|nr:MAG: hypothetical protein F9K16_02040 [Thermoanaerobaculia bacterium]